MQARDCAVREAVAGCTDGRSMMPALSEAVRQCVELWELIDRQWSHRAGSLR